jgi:hypothetical protein
VRGSACEAASWTSRSGARLRAGADWQDNDLIFCRFDGTPIRTC